MKVVAYVVVGLMIYLIYHWSKGVCQILTTVPLLTLAQYINVKLLVSALA